MVIKWEENLFYRRKKILKDLKTTRIMLRKNMLTKIS